MRRVKFGRQQSMSVVSGDSTAVLIRNPNGSMKEGYKRGAFEFFSTQDEVRKLQERVDELEKQLAEKSFHYNILEAQLKHLKDRLNKKEGGNFFSNLFKNSSNTAKNNDPEIDIESTVIHQDHPYVPKVLVECVKVLEENEAFLKTIGIYRVSGDFKEIESLRSELKAGNYASLKSLKTPHEITGIVKHFMRKLKKPIISVALLQKYIPSWEIFEKLDVGVQCSVIKNIITELDTFNRSTLLFMVNHFKKVLHHAPDNQMDIKSLSIVVGSCFLSETLSDGQFDNIVLMTKIPSYLLQIMIENSDKIFQVEKQP